MKKYKLIPLLLAAVMAAAPLTGCSPDKESSSVSVSMAPNGRQEGLADNEIKANIAEDTECNDTTFKLNSVIDSGMADENGNKYIYLDAVIGNSTDKEYDLNILNNFYLLLPDNSEAHFDVRTQLYGQKNIDNYIVNPFTVPASGEISGIFGGFVIAPDVENFTVCFFPTQEDMRNKSNVIKVDVTSENITKLS
ncbi:MAG: hypothetical protein J6B75_03325 [Ruminococcus sp.]|nr:hypothetical protein [Ruminococcus sp.]